jgi:hypothetical protein
MGKKSLLPIHQTRDLKPGYTGSTETKFPKISDPIKTWATELNRTFSKEEVQMAKKYMKKMLIIPGHEGNANQNRTKIPPHTLLVGI